MSFFDFAAVALAVAICLVPAILLRGRKIHARAKDFFVSSQSVPLDVVRNSSIAHTLRVAAFGPLFAWGAAGDIWPAIVGSVCFGLGLLLLSRLRQPVLEFASGALRDDRSVTVHAFIASRHGNDQAVGFLAASLTLFAFFGLIVLESIAVAALLEPIVGSTTWVCVSVLGLLTLAMLSAVFSGHSGVMYCAQLQLGMAYLGLAGSAALLLYLQASTLLPMPPYGMLAIVFIAAWCILILAYRRSKYVDTNLIRRADPGGSPSGASALKKFQQVLNPCISFFVVLAFVIAGMLFYFFGLPRVGSESIAALQAGTRLPAAGLIALILFPLFYPLVDVANWQRLAAVEKHIEEGKLESGLRPPIMRRFFRMYGGESPLLWLFLCMFGALAAVATETHAGADAMPAFMTQLVSDRNEATVLVLPLLLIGVFAIALSATTSMFSASLCTIRYDVLPWFRPELAAGAAQPGAEAAAMHRVRIAGAGFLIAIAAVFLIAEAALRISFSSSTFLALLFVLGCAQLAFLPLVLGPVLARTSGGSGAVSARCAVAVMGCSALSGTVAAAIYAATGREAWLWAVVPVCLGAGLLAYCMARLWPAKP